MTPIREKGIEPVIHLIVAELYQCRTQNPYYGRHGHQYKHITGIPASCLSPYSAAAVLAEGSGTVIHA